MLRGVQLAFVCLYAGTLWRKVAPGAVPAAPQEEARAAGKPDGGDAGMIQRRCEFIEAGEALAARGISVSTAL